MQVGARERRAHLAQHDVVAVVDRRRAATAPAYAAELRA